MKRKISGIIDICYTPLVIIFLIVILLQWLGFLSLPVKYNLLVFILPVLAVPALLQSGRPGENRFNIPSLLLLLAALVFALCIRLFPLTHSSIPLGYDPGFYKYVIELYYNALPAIPEESLAIWVKQMFEQGLFVLTDLLHIVTGLDAMGQVGYLFPFFGAILVFPVFIVTRNLFGPRAGIVASLLYAVSYTQYSAFTMFYLKNVIGLFLLLMAVYALEKKRDWLMSLMFAGLGIFHRPEFFLFALILIPYFIFNRRRGIIFAVLGAAVLTVPFWISRWEINWEIMAGGIGGGTLFGFDINFIVSIAYLPFAVMGAVYLAVNKKFNSLFFYFVITCVIVVFQLIFFNRFIIMFDLAVIILAAAGIDYTLLQKTGRLKVAGVVAVLLVLAVSGLPTLNEANEINPRLTEEQLQVVEWIGENTESDAYVLATGSDAPWVLGWSGRKVIAPGLFDWYIQDRDEWFDFIDSIDPETAREFVDVYDGPVYVYYSRKTGNYLPLEKFQGAFFQTVYNNKEAVVYKYLGGN